jgi:selenocysteine-specific elongation factor
MLLAPVGRLHPVQIIDVQLDVLRTAPRALRSRARVRVHLGAAEVLGRLRVLDSAGALEPGTSGFAQLRLEAPVVALPDERFIIRSYSPSLTIGGGRVLDPFAGKYRGKDLARVRERLRNLVEADRATRLAMFVETAGDPGLKLSDIAARTGWNDEVIRKTANEAKARGMLVEAGGVFLTSESFDRLCLATVEAVIDHHKREPLSRGLARETLRERHFDHSAPEIFRAVIARLEQDGKLVSEKDLVRAREHSLDLSGADAELRDRLAQIYEQAGLEAPSVDEVMARSGVAASERIHARKILQLLITGRVLIRVQGELFFHQQALEALQKKLFEYAVKHEPERAIDVATFKELAGVSRKYAIPLLEYFDSQRVTLRQGDRRIIVRMKAEG